MNQLAKPFSKPSQNFAQPLRFQDISVTTTDDRLIEVKLGGSTLLLWPGTAQGLAAKLLEAQKELFSDKYNPQLNQAKAADGVAVDSPNDSAHRS